jgi:hypothetical protein
MSSWALAVPEEYIEEFNGVKADWLKKSYQCEKTWTTFYDCTMCSKHATEAHVCTPAHMWKVNTRSQFKKSLLDLC